VVRAANAPVVHFRAATGESVCKAAPLGPIERLSLSLGKITCWRCLEKLLGEPPVDVR